MNSKLKRSNRSQQNLCQRRLPRSSSSRTTVNSNSTYSSLYWLVDTTNSIHIPYLHCAPRLNQSNRIEIGLNQIQINKQVKMTSKFPIPSTFQDLERDPYDLLPYPVGFADDDEVTRADSFDQLVVLLERGNRSLTNGGIELFDSFDSSTHESQEDWNSEDRIQALYTLVRCVCV